MQSKHGHPHHLFVSLRMLEVKAPAEKSSPNTGTDILYPTRDNQVKGYDLQQEMSVFHSISIQTSAPHSSSQCRGIYIPWVLPCLPVQPLHFLFQGRTEPIPITLSCSCTSLLPSPAVFSEHVLSTHPPDTFPSPAGMTAETHCSHHSVMMGKVFPPPLTKGQVSSLQSSSD